MSNQPKNFFFPPVFQDDERTRSAYLLHFILWMLISAVTLMELIDIVILPANIPRWLFIIILVNATSFILMFLSWKGYTATASTVLMIGMAVFLTILAITGGGVRTPGLILSSGIVFATGLLLGKGAGIFMALAFCLVGFGLVLADHLEILPHSDVQHTPLSIWINTILNLIFIACLQYISMRTINKLLHQVHQELADRKVAEIALRQNEEKYRQLFEIESDALFLIDQHSGHILDVNSSALRMYGHARRELLALANADLSAETEKLAEIFSQQPMSILSTLHRKKDGTVFPVEITVSHFDYQEQKVYLAAVRDITERKRAEERIKIISFHNEALLAAMPDIILEVDNYKIYTWTNKSGTEFFGENVLGKEMAYYFEGEQDIYEKLAPLFQGNENTIYLESWQRRHDGEKRLLALWCTVLKDGHGRVTGALYTGRDITAQKQAEEERRRLDAQIQQTQKLESLGVLAGGIAHDFNNMLMVITGNAELALQDLSEFSPARPMLLEIIKTSNRASELCKQMLTYSGKNIPVMKTMNLSEAVEEISRMIEFSISKKAVLQYRLSPNLPSIKADTSQVSQIVLNLVINASEALGEKEGTIVITTAHIECDGAYLAREQLQDEIPQGSYVCLEVADSGCGMDPQTIPKIFDPFFSTKFTGRGLGLSTVLGIVRKHGGALKVDSEPAKGSTFKIFFPAASISIETAVAQKTKKETWQGSGVVLLVEDEDSIRRVCRRMLERIGFEVLAAADGREALGLFRQHQNRITCVLLDLTMPHMDGGETFVELRRVKPDLPVIMSSGFSEQKVAKRFITNGLSAFIQKPYLQSDLAAVLKKVLERV